MVARVCLAFRPDAAADANLLRAAVVAWATARSSGGDLVVRTEGREPSEALSGLAWLGVDWDEGPAPDPEMADEPFTHLFDFGTNIRLPGPPVRVALSPLLPDENTPSELPSAAALAALGYLPAAVFNFLALLGWSPPNEGEILSRWDIRQQFSIDALSPEPAVFDRARLDRINRHYLDQLSTEALAALVRPFLEDIYDEMPMHEAWLLRLTAIIRGRVVRLADAVDLSGWAFEELARPTPAAAAVVREPSARPVLTRATAEVASVVLLDERTAAGILAGLERELAPVVTAAPSPRAILTAALVGEEGDWPTAEVMALLGKERVLRRLAAALR